jgi:hypothetical protein
MAVRVWASNAVTWRAVDINAPQMATGTASPATPGGTTAGNTPTFKGLEISLQLEGATNPLTKIFLLGAV